MSAFTQDTLLVSLLLIARLLKEQLVVGIFVVIVISKRDMMRFSFHTWLKVYKLENLRHFLQDVMIINKV